jgi:hypothetical protein
LRLLFLELTAGRLWFDGVWSRCFQYHGTFDVESITSDRSLPACTLPRASRPTASPSPPQQSSYTTGLDASSTGLCNRLAHDDCPGGNRSARQRKQPQDGTRWQALAEGFGWLVLRLLFKSWFSGFFVTCMAGWLAEWLGFGVGPSLSTSHLPFTCSTRPTSGSLQPATISLSLPASLP